MYFLSLIIIHKIILLDCVIITTVKPLIDNDENILKLYPQFVNFTLDCKYDTELDKIYDIINEILYGIMELMFYDLSKLFDHDIRGLFHLLICNSTKGCQIVEIILDTICHADSIPDDLRGRVRHVVEIVLVFVLGCQCEPCYSYKGCPNYSTTTTLKPEIP